MADRARWSWRRGRASQTAAGDGVDRRTLLMGAAATAGAVAAAASPAMASPAAPAAATVTNSTETVAAPAATGTVAASDVSVVPVGEIIDTDVQSALATLDSRLSKVQMFQDLQVAMTLVDDFMGNTATSGTIGQLGWALPATAPGTAAVASAAAAPGIFVIGTGTTSSGWQCINLGSNNLVGAPTLMCEFRIKLPNLNNGTDKFSCWFGLHNAVTGAEPTTGFYFRYTSADGPNWMAVCADGGNRTPVNTNVAADTDFHRFRLSCGADGAARFYIDDTQCGLVFNSLPTVNTYSANAAIRKTAGTTARALRVDYFALRFEQPR